MPNLQLEQLRAYHIVADTLAYTDYRVRLSSGQMVHLQISAHFRRSIEFLEHDIVRVHSPGVNDFRQWLLLEGFVDRAESATQMSALYTDQPMRDPLGVAPATPASFFTTIGRALNGSGK
jgi:hypothetical protein